MDIHSPHAIHSWKDFGIQLLTIAAGILIAADTLVGAIGIINAGGDPRDAPPGEVARFREQVVSLRGILFLEEPMSHTAGERDRKALE